MSRRTQVAKLVDWAQILSELERAGLSNSEVARQLQVLPSSICNWKHGTEPRYSDGARLVQLHAETPIPAAPISCFQDSESTLAVPKPEDASDSSTPSPRKAGKASFGKPRPTAWT